MKNQIIPKSWRESLDELREEISNTIERWFNRLKPEDRHEASAILPSDIWRRPLNSIMKEPKIDVEEKADAITVTAELPGIQKEDLQVDLDGRFLTLSGKKETNREEKHGTMHLSECHYGMFTRVISLPSEVDRDHVKAKFRRGVLKLKLPKTGDSKTRKVKILYEDTD